MTVTGYKLWLPVRVLFSCLLVCVALFYQLEYRRRSWDVALGSPNLHFYCRRYYAGPCLPVFPFLLSSDSCVNTFQRCAMEKRARKYDYIKSRLNI